MQHQIALYDRLEMPCSIMHISVTLHWWWKQHKQDVLFGCAIKFLMWASKVHSKGKNCPYILLVTNPWGNTL